MSDGDVVGHIDVHPPGRPLPALRWSGQRREIVGSWSRDITESSLGCAVCRCTRGVRTDISFLGGDAICWVCSPCALTLRFGSDANGPDQGCDLSPVGT